MWKPCTLFGARPPMSPLMCTPSPIGASARRPLTREPEAGATLAAARDTAACGTAGGGVATGAGAGAALGGGADACGAEAQPARTSVARLARTTWRITRLLAHGNRTIPARAGAGKRASASRASGAELAREGVAAEAEQRGGFATVAVRMRQRGLQQHLVKPRARFGMHVRRAAGQALARPRGERAVPIVRRRRGCAVRRQRGLEVGGRDRLARRQRGEA